MNREELQQYYENFIFKNHSHACSDRQIKNLDRLINANVYLSEHTELSFHKVCSMMIQTQDLLFSILPATTHEDYAQQFARLNDIVKWCKETIIELEKP